MESNEINAIADRISDKLIAIVKKQLGEPRVQPGPRWVKASERLPGWRQSVKWKSHEGVEVGKHPLFAMTDPGTAEAMEGWEWLDEQPAAGKEEELKVEIERRTKLLEDDLKRDCRLNMPGISEQEQEATWQAYKKRHSL